MSFRLHSSGLTEDPAGATAADVPRCSFASRCTNTADPNASPGRGRSWCIYIVLHLKLKSPIWPFLEEGCNYRMDQVKSAQRSILLDRVNIIDKLTQNSSPIK